MRYSLAVLLLQAESSLQQLDVESDVLRHKLAVAQKRADMLDYMLLEAKQKHRQPETAAEQSNDALRRKNLELESRVERLLGQHIDPAVSVLTQLVGRLHEMSRYEK